MYIISHIKSFWCLLKRKVDFQDILLRDFLHGSSTYLYFPSDSLLFCRRNSLKVRKKPFARRPLMENGKATQRKMKAEIVGSYTRQPWFLGDADGWTPQIPCSCVVFCAGKECKCKLHTVILSVCPVLYLHVQSQEVLNEWGKNFCIASAD